MGAVWIALPQRLGREQLRVFEALGNQVLV